MERKDGKKNEKMKSFERSTEGLEKLGMWWDRRGGLEDGTLDDEGVILAEEILKVLVDEAAEAGEC